MPVITTDIEYVIHELKKGKPVAIPTETVYGLAALIDNEKALLAVFSMKNRPLDHPLIVHIAQHWDLSTLVEDIPEYAQRLMKHFWPGPLTLVLRSKKNSINPLVTGGQATVAIRCPAHPLTQELLKRVHTPLVAPSANPFGKISPTTAAHVKESFSKEDLTILEGGRCRIGIESTIVDASRSEGYQIVRQGLIDETEIAKVSLISPVLGDNVVRVPGKLETHYQPKKTLYYFEHFDSLIRFCQAGKEKPYLIASRRPDFIHFAHFFRLSDQPNEVAFELFFQLRKADASKASAIAIELPPKTSRWEGVRERILKAGRPIGE